MELWVIGFIGMWLTVTTVIGILYFKGDAKTNSKEKSASELLKKD